MSVHLTPRIEALIQQKIDAGQYETPDDLIEHALVALEQQERSASLRAKLQIGLDELQRGEGIPFSKDWSAERRQIAFERAVAGESPHPDVLPAS
jgi:antitoxin ParD1/3/4